MPNSAGQHPKSRSHRDGAATTGIAGLLSKDFLKLVVIALVIASPLAYFFMDKWLQDFAYRIDIHWTVFVLAGVAAAAAFLTVSFSRPRVGMKAALVPSTRE